MDLDHCSRFELLKTFFNSHYFFPDSKVEVKETGRGHHFRIFKGGLTVQQNLQVRRSLGDDVGRIAFDETRARCPELHSWIDTLFEFKWYGKKVTRETPCNVLSEPFWSHLPCRKS